MLLYFCSIHHVSSGRYTVCPPLPSQSRPSKLTNPPLQPARPLLQRCRVPQIHHLLPHPKRASRNDEPRPRTPRPLLPLPRPRHRLRFRSLGRDPLLRSSISRRSPHMGRHGHRSVHAGHSAPTRRGGRSPAGGYRAGRSLSSRDF